jgi:pilus assembly protein Flp/PilA
MLLRKHSCGFQFTKADASVDIKGKPMKPFCKRFWKDAHGQDLVEYALATGLVAVAAVAALPALSTTVSNVFAKIGSIISSSVN